jgi:hypothetical protein
MQRGLKYKELRGGGSIIRKVDTYPNITHVKISHIKHAIIHAKQYYGEPNTILMIVAKMNFVRHVRFQNYSFIFSRLVLLKTLSPTTKVSSIKSTLNRG